ncbi:MAG: tripartite tricarboxylate transporter substrate-binding protein, partial [Burkholderiales bacterium]
MKEQLHSTEIRLLAIILCGLALTDVANAQKWPQRPVTLVVPFAAGGPTDTIARLIAGSMSKTLGKSVVVESRTGAGGTRAAALVAAAEPNGYTFLIHHNGMATAPALYSKLDYDPLISFEYVGQVVDVPMTIVGRKGLPPSNMKELIAYLKFNKDKVNIGDAGPGAVSQLCAMLLRKSLDVPLTGVPFQGTGPAMVALEGGHVDLMCDQSTQTLPHIQSGRIKVYATTTRKRIAALPDTPTANESGLKDFEVLVWHGIYAPKGTPKEALDKFNAALKTALKDPALAKRVAELGGQVVPESKQTPAGLRDWLKAEIEKWMPIIRASGAYIE